MTSIHVPPSFPHVGDAGVDEDQYNVYTRAGEHEMNVFVKPACAQHEYEELECDGVGHIAVIEAEGDIYLAHIVDGDVEDAVTINPK